MIKYLLILTDVEVNQYYYSFSSDKNKEELNEELINVLKKSTLIYPGVFYNHSVRPNYGEKYVILTLDEFWEKHLN